MVKYILAAELVRGKAAGCGGAAHGRVAPRHATAAAVIPAEHPLRRHPGRAQRPHGGAKASYLKIKCDSPATCGERWSKRLARCTAHHAFLASPASPARSSSSG